MSILTLCQSLENTAVGTAIREGYWPYIIAQTSHMLGMALFGGTVLIGDLRLLGRLRTPAVSELFRQLLPLKWIGFFVSVLSGAALTLGNATRLYNNVAFLAKLVLLLLIAVNAWVFRSMIYRDVAVWDKTGKTCSGAKLAALVSLILWAGVIFASRAIAFAMGPE